MTFVYVLVFTMWHTGKTEGLATLELKEYSTYEACKTAAEMTDAEQYSKRYPNGRNRDRDRVAAWGIYQCLTRPF